MPPRTLTANDVLGFEYDWLASDFDGCVALFSTAGAGYAPRGFLEDPEAHDQAIAAILAMPATHEVQFAPSLASSVDNTWRRVAQRGLFAFDCDPNGGPYRRVAAPVTPCRVDAMPTLVREVASRLQLRCARFAHLTLVTADQLCTAPSVLPTS